MVTLILSSGIAYIFTCAAAISVAQRINAIGPMADSESLVVASISSALTFLSGALLVHSIVPMLGKTNHISRSKTFLLGTANLLMSVLGIIAAWVIYADSVSCRGCETGSCEGLVFFRSLKLWGAGAIGAVAILLISKSFKHRNAISSGTHQD